MLPPNDVRGFVHRRIFGAIKGGLTGGIPGAIAGAITSGRRAGRRSGGQPTAPVFRTQPVPPGRRQPINQPRIALTGQLPGSPSCNPPLVLVNGICVSPGSPGSIDVGSGEAVMGQFGAALIPMSETRFVRECLPGMVLGKDGLCYNKGSIPNKARAYPRGTRPLGTPGEMAALRKAASFGRRMETTVKRMQKIGVLKKPAPRKVQPKFSPPHRQLPPGPSIINVE